MWKQRVVMSALLAVGMSSPLLAEDRAGQQNQSDRQHRVVMHLNSGDEKVQRGVLNNIRHLYQALGHDRLQLELVVHGAGLGLVTKTRTTLGAELTQLKAEYGVQYTACSNTMKAMQVSREDLLDEVGDTVPAMVRLMERQEQGWAYIKP
jgi:intracellular sulfur oxidation DsrE/DsrF family protein